MVISNILDKIFFVKCGNGTATGFTIYLNSEEYLVTAKHAVECKQPVQIFYDQKWIEVGHDIIESPVADIAVIHTEKRLREKPLELEYLSDGIIYSQDVYFLGFPYGFYNSASDSYLGNFPTPFVKKGILSAIWPGRTTQLFVDGHNNKGFSGGPVVFKDIATKKWKIASVISGYHAPLENIVDQNMNETGLKYQENSGLLISHAIEHALDLIR